MTVTVAALGDLAPADLDAWEDLAASALEPNVWVEPTFLLGDAASLPGGAELRVAYVSGVNGRWDAALFWTPELYSLRGGAFPSASTHGLYLSTYSARQPLAVRADGAVGALARLVNELGRGDLPGALALDKIPGGPMLDALRVASAQVGAVMLERPRGRMARSTAVRSTETFSGTLRTPHQDDEPFTRYALGKIARLSRRIGAPIAVEDWAQRPDIIDVFSEFQARGWKGDRERGGDGLALNPSRKVDFERIAYSFRDRGRLRVQAVHANDDLLYMGVVMQSAAGKCFGITNTYNERFSKERPGVIGQLAAVLSLTRGPAALDFDPSVAPESPQPDRVYTEVVPATAALVTRRGAKARALTRTARWVATAKGPQHAASRVNE